MRELMQARLMRATTGLPTRRTPWLAAVVAAILLASTAAPARAYGNVYGYWTSLGCSFEGHASADTSLGHAHTFNAGCAERVRVKMQYKHPNGVWYLYGESNIPTYGTYAQIDLNRWSHTVMVYGTHQVMVSGLWRQEEFTMTW